MVISELGFTHSVCAAAALEKRTRQRTQAVAKNLVGIMADKASGDPEKWHVQGCLL